MGKVYWSHNSSLDYISRQIMEQEKLWGADRSFYHTLIQLSMNMNVDIHLINRLHVGCQSVSRAITLTSDDKC